MKSITQLRKMQTKCIRYIFFSIASASVRHSSESRNLPKTGMTLFFAAVLTFYFITLQTFNCVAQNVLVTDDSAYVAKSSAILDIKASNKGLLMPRVKLTSTSSALPITSPDSSLIVYNTATAGNVTPGYYFWDGGKWVRMANGQGGLNVVTKTASATLLTTETMVLASGNITITLPAITSTDDGLAISIKNIGTYTDLITVIPNGAATGDGISTSSLTRWKGRTYVAAGGNWFVQNKENRTDNIFDISATGSWTTIAEMIAFLNLHMPAPTVVVLGGGTYTIAATQTINLPYPVTFEGISYGETTIAATAGVSGSSLFTCQTECYFKMLIFTAISNTVGNDAIRFTGSAYHEVKDCDFSGFNRGIVSTNNNDLWVFETDFENCAGAGVEVAAGAASGGTMELSECDFTQCAKGISLLSGVAENVSIMNSDFYNTIAGTDIGILYTPASFTSFANIYITSNTWNNQGTYINGFDFTRADGRDASALIEANAGVGDSKPRCKINVKDNASFTTMATALTYYKAVWTNTSSIPCKFTVNNNRITYQSSNGRNAFITLTGDISDNWYNTTLTIAVIKNGVTTVPYGETNISITAGLQPFQYATVIEIDNVAKNDYFEVYCYSNHASDQVTFQDVQWYTECK